MGQLVDHVAHVFVLSDLRVTECNALFALYTDDSCTIRESDNRCFKQRKISIVCSKFDPENKKCVQIELRKEEMCELFQKI